jgi:hypothetical protein
MNTMSPLANCGTCQRILNEVQVLRKVNLCGIRSERFKAQELDALRKLASTTGVRPMSSGSAFLRRAHLLSPPGPGLSGGASPNHPWHLPFAPSSPSMFM